MNDSFIITSCNKDEISKIILEFNNNKAADNNSIYPFENFKISKTQPWGLGKIYNSNFIFTFVIVKVR